MRDPEHVPEYAGLYWTYPVQWAGRASLPADVDEAAALSRTVRYQRDLVRAHVAGEGGRLVREVAFMEVVPDRPSEAIEDAMRAIVTECRSRRVCLAFVDFGLAHGWRDHGPLGRIVRAHDLRTDPLYPDPIDMDGEPFDPVEHFRRWRKVDREFRDGRAATATEALSIAAETFPPGHGRNVRIADHLNALGVTTHSGRSWTPDNVRMALKAMPVDVVPFGPAP